MLGCTGSGTHSDEGRGVGRTPQPSDTLYTMEAAMEAFALDPERALLIIDSAEIVGNLSDFGADLLRAKVYSWTFEEMNYDSAILIGERLMQHDSVKADPYRQEDVLELLMNACRLRKDYEQALHWATQLGELYRSQGEETEALRTEAEIGTFLIRIGEQEEGLARIDTVIQQLDGKRKFNELDASIIALKRKAEICIEKRLYADVIPAAQHMLDHLDDYEQHPADYHDGNIREPSDDERPTYIDFYRGKAYAYLAAVYASLEYSVESEEWADARRQAREYLALYDQTIASQNITGRFMISSTLRKLEEYDRVLVIYDEVERELGTDTLNANYVEILRGRAEAADAQGRRAEAKGYWKQYAALNELLTEHLLQGKAHLYAARFHAQEQQREIEQQREATRRAVASRTVIGFIGLLIFLFALYAVGQWRKMQRHNRILAQQITETVEYKEKYKKLKRSAEATTKKEDISLSTPNSKPTTDNPKLPTDNSSDADLFAYLRDLIEREQLFLNPQFERQTLINRTGLSKERIGAAFAQGSGHERLTTLVREMRLDYAVRLMNEQPELTIEQVCQASGFANADTFTRNFRAKFGMTPTAYRGTLG
jgi:AraC-like DNA-binding protein